MIKKYDTENKFISIFEPKTGFYLRSGVIENGKDTGVDPFMASFPELLDIGIMETCVCSHKCNIDCYQKAISRTGSNMSVRDFESIILQSKGKLFQVALGGAGDPDTHESFEDILKICRAHNIVPNFTTSGIAMTEHKAEICKKYCGAVAVSEHFADYTSKALDLLLSVGVKTNIHYVLSSESIENAIDMLKTNGFKKGINAVVFLLYKPVGLGCKEKVLNVRNPKVKEFFRLIDKSNFDFKVGFDSCSCSGIVNYSKNINLESIDFCEGGRYSAYIDANMHMMPCSFANQNSNWFVDLKKHTIQEAWESEIFEKFRYSLRNSCPKCANKCNCAGGCPLVNEITLCDRKERKLNQKN